MTKPVTVLRAAAAVLPALLFGCLSGCSGKPSDYGITGPTPNPTATLTPLPEPPPDDALLQPPGLQQDTGARFAPTLQPTTGGSSTPYYGYN